MPEVSDDSVDPSGCLIFTGWCSSGGCCIIYGRYAGDTYVDVAPESATSDSEGLLMVTLCGGESISNVFISKVCLCSNFLLLQVFVELQFTL